MSSVSSDSPATNFPGHVPESPFEQSILEGEHAVRADRIRLAYDVLRLFRVASSISDETFALERWRPGRLHGLSVVKIRTYLLRVLDARLSPEMPVLAWSNTMGDMATAVQDHPDDRESDVAARLRKTLMRRFPTRGDGNAAEVWRNFRDILAVLGPIFAGEVTRADLSA